MKFPWQISAGAAFELLRPAALVASAMLSAWVLASARRWRFHPLVAAGWTLGTLLFPFVVLPIYLIVRGSAKRRAQSAETESRDRSVEAIEAAMLVTTVARRSFWPAVYLLALVSAIGLYLYRDYISVDGHLARAEQAKLGPQPARTIREYRAALALENNPHTHKLLGVELASAGQWTEALQEFRLAEQGSEPDESLPFRIAQVLMAKGDHGGSVREYERFLDSRACRQQLPDARCEIARNGVTPNGR